IAFRLDGPRRYGRGEAMRTFALTVGLLAMVVGAAYAGDDDPEPPATGGKSLRALRGKWTAIQRISGGQTSAYTTTSYEFDGEKVTYTLKSKKGGDNPRPMKAKIDPKRPGVLELTPDTGKGTRRHFFKIEKDKLYLTVDRGDDPNAKADFTGNVAPVLVYQK